MLIASGSYRCGPLTVLPVVRGSTPGDYVGVRQGEVLVDACPDCFAAEELDAGWFSEESFGV